VEVSLLVLLLSARLAYELNELILEYIEVFSRLYFQFTVGIDSLLFFARVIVLLIEPVYKSPRNNNRVRVVTI
jgi:hypothetical protein